MGKEEHSQTADKRHYVLIGYVAICVAMIFMTLVLAFTSEVQTAQATGTATRTRSPYQLTLDADYATVAPTHSGSRSDEHSVVTPTPTRSGS